MGIRTAGVVATAEMVGSTEDVEAFKSAFLVC